MQLETAIVHGSPLPFDLMENQSCAYCRSGLFNFSDSRTSFACCGTDLNHLNVRLVTFHDYRNLFQARAFCLGI